MIAARLGQKKLEAPAVGLRLEARAITRALALQLHLSRYAAGLGSSTGKGPETLPVLLAELLADLGKDKVGILRLEASHRPEKKSRLAPITPSVLSPRGARGLREAKAQGAAPSPHGSGEHAAPTRLLPRAIPFDAPLRKGATLSVEHRLYTVESVAFERRLDAVEWWRQQPISRDYVRVWLQAASGGMEAVVYVDRRTGKRMIQGFCD